MGHHTLLLAHRGWSAKYPENTLLAMTRALELGVDGLEFDVQLTRDGVPVILHDPTVDRTTDGTGRVDSLTFAELRSLNAAKRFADRPDVGRRPIPTLEEVLDEAARLMPQGFFNIEVKVYNEQWRQLVDAVVPLVTAHTMGQRVVFSSFYHPAMVYMKEKYPHTEIGLLYENLPEQPWKAAIEVQAYSVNLDHHHVTSELLAACHDHGVRVSLWTVDDPQRIQEFIRQNADVVISNAPDVAMKARREM